MSFTLAAYEGTAQEVVAEMATIPQNTREEEILEVIKKSIAEIVTSVGGYISVTGNGHLNPAAGETGDSISINIVSLPVPASAPVSVESTLTNPEAKTNEQIEQEAQQDIGQVEAQEIAQATTPPDQSFIPVEEVSVPSAETTEIPPGEPTTVAEVESTQETPASNFPTEDVSESVAQSPPVETTPTQYKGLEDIPF